MSLAQLFERLFRACLSILSFVGKYTGAWSESRSRLLVRPPPQVYFLPAQKRVETPDAAENSDAPEHASITNGEPEGNGSESVTQSPNKPKTVLVTGARGFLGLYVARALLADDELKGKVNVIIADTTLPVPGTSRDYDERITYVACDLSREDHIQKILDGVDSIVHIASLKQLVGAWPEDLRRVNVGSTKNLVKVAKDCGVGELVYTSVATVVLEKEDKGPLTELDESAPYPTEYVDLYTQTKAAAELEVLSANSSTEGLKTVVLRPSSVFGAGDGSFSDLYVTGQSRSFIGDGSGCIDIVHVDDVARGHVQCLKALWDAQRRKVVTGQIYNLCQGQGTSYRDFAGYVNCWGYGQAKSVPYWTVWGMSIINEIFGALFAVPTFGPGLSLHAVQFSQRQYLFSNAKAERDFGWQPARPVFETVKLMVSDWNARKPKAGAAQTNMQAVAGGPTARDAENALRANMKAAAARVEVAGGQQDPQVKKTQ